MYIIPKIMRKIVGYPAIKKSNIDKTAKIDVFSVVVDSSFGKYSYLGEHSSVINVQIGAFTSISNYCAIGGGGHTIDWVSTSPVFNNSKSILNVHLANLEFNPFKKTTIGNDVWIGSHCLIKSGVSIADGAVVGMGSIVTKNIGPYEIWAGNPARMIRKRFDDETTESLLESTWWEWEDEKLKRKSDKFNSINDFLRR